MQAPKSFFQDILRCVNISVVNSPTLRADPLSHREIFHLWILGSTAGTDLGGCKEPIDLYDLFSIPLSLVFQLSNELTPGDIRDLLRQLMIPHHVLDAKILHADDVVISDQLSGEFMQGVHPLIMDLLMETSYLQFSLSSIVAPL